MFYNTRSHLGSIHVPCRMKRRLIQAAPHLSHRLLQRLLQSTGLDEDVTRQRMQAEVDSLLDITTPYGKLVETMHLDSVEEGPATQVPLHYANPFALVWHLCIKIPRFAHFLHRCYEQAAKKLRKTALYTDEATPGNQLGPELTTSSKCLLDISLLPTLVQAQKTWVVADCNNEDCSPTPCAGRPVLCNEACAAFVLQSGRVQPISGYAHSSPSSWAPGGHHHSGGEWTYDPGPQGPSTHERHQGDQWHQMLSEVQGRGQHSSSAPWG